MERRDLVRQYNISSVKWSATEKKIARQVFEMALQRELDAVTQKVKKMALDIKAPSDLWKIEEYLTRSRKAIDAKYDYRYSQLPLVFGQLARDGLITLKDLQGLAEDKLSYVRLLAGSSAG